jgi:hypothetical protein
MVAGRRNFKPGKDWTMLISQSQSETIGRQGSRSPDFAELRRQVANPSEMDESSRQRLMDLARRLARVRAMGDEYHRVDLSDYAASVLMNATGV